MALLRRTLPTTGPLPALRRALGYLPDLLVWGAIVAWLELLGTWGRGDAADLLALSALTFVGFGLHHASRSGLLPATRAIGGAVIRFGRSIGPRLAPRYALAFRPSTGVVPLPDRTLLPLLAGGLAIGTAFSFAGGTIFLGLTLLKTHVSYTLYLLVLGTLWGLLGAVLLFGIVAGNQWIRQAAALPHRGLRPPPRLTISLGWILGMIALGLLPGWVAIAGVLALGGGLALGLATQPPTPYLFCRRDALGRPLVVSVDTFLRRAYWAVVICLTAVVAIGQAGRAGATGWPDGRFALTQALGRLASLAAVLLLVRAALHLRRSTGGGASPELPLVPTIWDRTGNDAPSAWRRAAEARAFRIVPDERPPRDGFDLVVGDAANPARFIPRPDADEEALGWQVLRRYHVVMRRRFSKRMQHLVKALRASDRRGGSGFLFCPHAWLVQGVVRDADVVERGSGSLVGPGVIGPSYGQVFSPRVRRYLGGILRSLEIDIIYFEDAIRWPDLKRVFGVAFEIHDQGRGPLEPRHFVGIPRVRVLVQEEPAEADPLPARPYPTPAPGHVRVLVIMRDRGGEEEAVAPAPPGHRRRLPSLV